MTSARARARDAIKRTMDVIGAGLALIMLSPVIAAIAIAILARDGRPILFRQIRPGLLGQTFTLIKFRTMRPPGPNEVWYETDADRVSTMGRFLRRTSLDELPELWNVLRGEMSLVGPRPLLVEYLTAYTPEQARRHEVRPGLTSWAVVNGRHTLRFDERLSLDVWYVDHQSLSLDLRIVGRTLLLLASGQHVAVTQDIREVGFPLPAHSAPQTTDTASDRSLTDPGANEPDLPLNPRR